MSKKIYTAKEVAKILGIHYVYLITLLSEGKTEKIDKKFKYEKFHDKWIFYKKSA